MSLQLLHYSDLETAYDDPPSLARLATAIERERTADTLVIGTGDNTAPGALPLAREGRQADAFFEAVTPAVDTLGNHDFDFGVKRARERVRETPQTWVAANLYEPDADLGEEHAQRESGTMADNPDGTDASRFAADDGLLPWTIVSTRSYRVGIVGVVHPNTDRMNPRATELTVLPALPAAKRAVEAVRERDVDAVVLAAHVGSGRPDGPDGKALAARLPVDAVLDGHDHAPAVERTEDGTPYVRPGKGADTLTRVDFDPDEREADAPRSATVDHSDTSVDRIDTDAYHPDERIVDAMERQAADAGLDEAVTRLSTTVDCGPRAVDAGESRIGNLVTDAFRAVADADVAIMAPEGIRSQSPLRGDLTVWDLHALVPFGGDVVSLSVPGDRLETVLDALSFDHVDAFQDWAFGHVSGANLTFDESGDLQAAAIDGSALDPARTYHLATSQYYVANEDLFPWLSPDDVVDRHGPQYEVITDHVRETATVPPVAGRIDRPSDR